MVFSVVEKKRKLNDENADNVQSEASTSGKKVAFKKKKTKHIKKHGKR